MKKKTPAKKKTKKTSVTKLVYSPVFAPVVRQLEVKQTAKGFRHIVRVVRECTPEMLKFNTIESLNEFLFQFDFENHGVDPCDSGNWIDFIMVDVFGPVFTSEDLEKAEEDEQDL